MDGEGRGWMGVNSRCEVKFRCSWAVELDERNSMAYFSLHSIKLMTLLTFSVHRSLISSSAHFSPPVYTQEEHEYHIRVFARNEVGASDPLETDEPVKMIRPDGEYSPSPLVFILLLTASSSSSSCMLIHIHDCFPLPSSLYIVL